MSIYTVSQVPVTTLPVTTLEANYLVFSLQLEDTEEAHVHSGFLRRFTIAAASQEYKATLQIARASSEIVFTGHSLGGAVAMLAALSYKLRWVV